MIPDWARPLLRTSSWTCWIFIPRNAKYFDKLVEDAKCSDHGEERAVDIFVKGALCYYRDNGLPNKVSEMLVERLQERMSELPLAMTKSSEVFDTVRELLNLLRGVE